MNLNTEYHFERIYDWAGLDIIVNCIVLVSHTSFFFLKSFKVLFKDILFVPPSLQFTDGPGPGPGCISRSKHQSMYKYCKLILCWRVIITDCAFKTWRSSYSPNPLNRQHYHYSPVSSMGPFSVTQPNPTHQFTDPTQPYPTHGNLKNLDSTQPIRI